MNHLLILPIGNIVKFLFLQVPDIIDNAYVIVEFENGSRGMLDLCMFAEGSKNEQEISVVGDIGKVMKNLHSSPPTRYARVEPMIQGAVLSFTTYSCSTALPHQ